MFGACYIFACGFRSPVAHPVEILLLIDDREQLGGDRLSANQGARRRILCRHKRGLERQKSDSLNQSSSRRLWTVEIYFTVVFFCSIWLRKVLCVWQPGCVKMRHISDELHLEKRRTETKILGGDPNRLSLFRVLKESWDM